MLPMRRAAENQRKGEETESQHIPWGSKLKQSSLDLVTSGKPQFYTSSHLLLSNTSAQSPFIYSTFGTQHHIKEDLSRGHPRNFPLFKTLRDNTYMYMYVR